MDHMRSHTKTVKDCHGEGQPEEDPSGPLESSVSGVVLLGTTPMVVYLGLDPPSDKEMAYWPYVGVGADVGERKLSPYGRKCRRHPVLIIMSWNDLPRRMD